MYQSTTMSAYNTLIYVNMSLDNIIAGLFLIHVGVFSASTLARLVYDITNSLRDLF